MSKSFKPLLIITMYVVALIIGVLSFTNFFVVTTDPRALDALRCVTSSVCVEVPATDIMIYRK